MAKQLKTMSGYDCRNNEFSVSDEMLWVTGQTGRRQEDSSSDQSVRLYSDTVELLPNVADCRRLFCWLWKTLISVVNIPHCFDVQKTEKKLFQLSIVQSWHINHVHVRYMLSPVRLSSLCPGM